MKQSKWSTKRTKPYTPAGIKKLACIRCGINEAEHQWQICADKNYYRPLCGRCDVSLNRAVLQFMRHPDVNYVADAYEARTIKDPS